MRGITCHLFLCVAIMALLGCQLISKLSERAPSTATQTSETPPAIQINHSIVWIVNEQARQVAVMGFLVGYPDIPSQRNVYVVTAWHNIAHGGPLRILQWGEDGRYRTVQVYPESAVIRVDRDRDLAILRLDSVLRGTYAVQEPSQHEQHPQLTGFRMGTHSIQSGLVYQIHALGYPPASRSLRVSNVPRMTAECRLQGMSRAPLSDPILGGAAGRREVTTAVVHCRQDVDDNAVGSPLVLGDTVVGVVVAHESSASTEPVFRVVPADVLIDLVAEAHEAARNPHPTPEAEARIALTRLLRDVWTRYLPDHAPAPLSDVIDRDDMPDIHALSSLVAWNPGLAALEFATLVDRGNAFGETLALATTATSRRSSWLGSASRSPDEFLRGIAVDLLRVRLRYDRQHTPEVVSITSDPESVHHICGESRTLVRFRVGAQDGWVCASERYGQWTLRPTVDPSTDHTRGALRNIRDGDSWRIAALSLQPNVPDLATATMLDVELHPRQFDAHGRAHTYTAHLRVDHQPRWDFQCFWNHDRIECWNPERVATWTPTQLQWVPVGFALWVDPQGQNHINFVDRREEGYTLRHGLLNLNTEPER